MKFKPLDYQRKMKEQLEIFVTLDRDRELQHIYESLEAAQLEVDFAKKHYKERLTIRIMNVHSLALAMDRWGD